LRHGPSIAAVTRNTPTFLASRATSD
jgi:hypothetical protein